MATARHFAVIGLLVGALLTTGATPAPTPTKSLDDYATWDDVVAAQNDVDKQNALIDDIHAQIDRLNSEVATAEKVSADASAKYAAAEQASTEQNEKLYALQQQTKDAEAAADDAETRAANYVAAIANRVPTDPTVELLTNPTHADDFLRGMSTLSKLGTDNGAAYEAAISARNTADQLSKQAQVAADELARLQQQAQDAYNQAVAAQLELQNKRDEKSQRGSELEAMLGPLEEHRDVVEADYKEGERLREEERKRQEEAARKAREEAMRQAQEEAARRAAAGRDSASSAPAPAPAPVVGPPAADSNAVIGNYASPIATNAYVTDPYGMRLHPIQGIYRLHTGMDLVVPGGTCWAPLYAATSGTVTYASWMDGWGNLLVFEGDDGYTYKYAHISDGGMNVVPGQRVSPGQLVAYAGTTGPSTGCHLHFQMERNGSTLDPQPILASRGWAFY